MELPRPERMACSAALLQEMILKEQRAMAIEFHRIRARASDHTANAQQMQPGDSYTYRCHIPGLSQLERLEASKCKSRRVTFSEQGVAGI
jgi:hypothetical protein